MPYLHADMTPTYWEVEQTEVYTRGEELHDARYGPIQPYVETEQDKRATRASREFENAFGREPEAGDILRYRHIELAHHPDLISAEYSLFIDAWKRALPQRPSPLSGDEGRNFQKSLTANSSNSAVRRGPRGEGRTVDRRRLHSGSVVLALHRA
jgi:hypothetical protein